MSGNKKVGVIAGTKVDTQMGLKKLRDDSITTRGEYITEDPDATTNLQVLEKNKLLTIMLDKANKLIENHDVDAICIYCNSLSTAVDLSKLRDRINIPIVTPLETYQKAAKNYSPIGVISANCQASAGIEKIIQNQNPDIQVIGIGLIPLVHAIEENISPEQIVDKFGLEKLAFFMEKTGVEVIILGCTHFPYLTNEFKNIFTVDIFDPAEEIRKKIKEIL